MALRVVRPCSPMSPAHGAHVSFRRAKANFHLYIVQVWHGEPGNMHPCNSDA